MKRVSLYKLDSHACVGDVPTVVRSVRLNAATLGTFVNHLSWFQLEAFYIFLSSIPFWHCTLTKKTPTRHKLF